MRIQTNYFQDLAGAVAVLDPPRARGRVAACSGVSAEVEGLAAPVGGWMILSRADGSAIEGEVTGVRSSRTMLELLEPGYGVTPGGPAEFGGRVAMARVSRALMGRSIDATGRPADGRGPVWGGVTVALPQTEAGRSRSSRCTLVRNGDCERRASYLVEAAREHDGPVVALLVGGTNESHEAFREHLGDAAARTACVVEPGRPTPVLLRRAARVAAATAIFLARVEAKRALLVADWRAGGTAPVGVELTESVHSIWSFSRAEEEIGVGARMAA